MKRLAQIVSVVALGLTVAAPMLFFADRLELPNAKLWMLAAAVAWFASAPFWMERRARD